jgi:hypothetical protein
MLQRFTDSIATHDAAMSGSAHRSSLRDNRHVFVYIVFCAAQRIELHACSNGLMRKKYGSPKSETF